MTSARARRTAAERRDQLVEVAVRAFAAGGYAGTTTDQVARLAGVSQPYVVRLFGTKQALFTAAYNHICDRVEDSFRRAAGELGSRFAPGDGRRTSLRELGAAGFRELITAPDVVAMTLHGYAAAAADPVIAAVVRERFGRVYLLARELTCADPAEVRDFMAAGALLNVLAGLGVLGTGPDESWARELLALYLAEHEDSPTAGTRSEAT